jgi:hypothetical protein
MAATRSMVKAAALAVAVLLFLIGGFLEDNTTLDMWGVGFALVALTLLLDVLVSFKVSVSGGS